MSNQYKVPKKQWAKWSEQARHVFNELYRTMIHNQGTFMHPKDSHRPAAHWKTVCWNASWMAADAVRVYPQSLT